VGRIRKYLPDGGRHEYSKAVAGTLLRKGYNADDLAEILEIVWADAKAPRKDGQSAARNVHDTARKLENDKPFTGGTTLKWAIFAVAWAMLAGSELLRTPSRRSCSPPVLCCRLSAGRTAPRVVA
jgi:hypothetical protein